MHRGQALVVRTWQLFLWWPFVVHYSLRLVFRLSAACPLLKCERIEKCPRSRDSEQVRDGEISSFRVYGSSCLSNCCFYLRDVYILPGANSAPVPVNPRYSVIREPAMLPASLTPFLVLSRSSSIVLGKMYDYPSVAYTKSCIHVMRWHINGDGI